MNNQTYIFPEPYTHLVEKLQWEPNWDGTFVERHKISVSDTFREAYAGKDIEHVEGVTFKMDWWRPVIETEEDYNDALYEAKNELTQFPHKVAYPIVKTEQEDWEYAQRLMEDTVSRPVAIGIMKKLQQHFRITRKKAIYGTRDNTAT